MFSLGTATLALATGGSPALATDGTQSSAAKPAAAARKSPETNEVALLRKKLDALEQILIQNQQENAKLRQQLHALEAQQHKMAALSPKTPPVSKASAEQIAATEDMLRTLQQQQALLHTQTQQADALYRNGSTTYMDATRKKADEEINRARVQAAEAQLKELKAGHKRSVKEQILAELREHLTEDQVNLGQEQERLKIANARYKAAVTTYNEVTEAEYRVRQAEGDISKIKAQIAQTTGL